MTRLFKSEDVKKFFNILERLSGSIPVDKSNYPWENYHTVYTKDSNHTPSTREVFVHRTVNKWLKGKYLVIYRESDLGVIYKQYVSISLLHYYNDYSSTGYVGASLIDYVNPYSSSIFGTEKEKYNHNNTLNLEGEWSKNPDVHHSFLEMISMNDVPKKEYVFKAYDFKKYPKKVKKGSNPRDIMETTKSFIAKTEHEAYQLKNKFEKEDKSENIDDKLLISELVEVKNI